MTTPLVSVITRTRNRPRFLARALRSVAEQRFSDWELLVVNDGGAPLSVGADARVRVLTLDGVGRGRAANEGLAAARGTLVVFHDDDDTWHPDFLQVAVDAWKRSGRRGVVTRSEHVFERVDGERLVEVRRAPFFPELAAVSLAELARESCFVNLAFLAEREAVREVGGYDPTLPLYEDWDFNLRFLMRFDVEVVPQVLAHYHLREEASGEARNSFAQEARRTADARAVLVNRWLRDPNTRHVGQLMALGPTLRTVESLSERVDKLFNLVHGVRQKWPLRAVESWLGRG